MTVLASGSGSAKAPPNLKAGYDALQTNCACDKKPRNAGPPP